MVGSWPYPQTLYQAERHAKIQHSSQKLTLVNYARKKFYKIFRSTTVRLFWEQAGRGTFQYNSQKMNLNRKRGEGGEGEGEGERERSDITKPW